MAFPVPALVGITDTNAPGVQGLQRGAQLGG